MVPRFFVPAASQSPGLAATLAAAYNPGMCHLALPVIVPENLWKRIPRK